MNYLSLLVLLASLLAGYVVAKFVPEEVRDGKKWFYVALVFFAILFVVFWVANGFGVQALMALAGMLFVVGTLIKARKG